MNNFAANIFELWGLAFQGQFSTYMYKGGFYFTVLLFVLIFPLLVWFIYYKVLDNIRLATRKVWTIILIAVMVISGIFAYWYSYNSIDNYLFMHQITNSEITYSNMFTFAIIATLWTGVFSLLYSWALKYASVKSRKVPF